MSKSSVTKRCQDLVAVLLLAAMTVATYGICLTDMLGHCDDYWLLWQWRQQPGEVIKVWNAAGRWANGLIFQIAWANTNSVDDLWQPRLVSIIGVWTLATAIYASLRRLEYSWELSLAVAGLAGFLCPITVYVAYAACCGFAYACLAATAAFWVADCGLHRDSVWAKGGFAVIAIGILLVGFCIYQPAGMFYVVMLMFLFGSRQRATHSANVRLRIVLHAVVLMASIGGSVVLFRLMTCEVAGIDIPQRAAFLEVPVHKLGRFVLRPVGQSCMVFFLGDNQSKVTMLAAAIAAIGIWIPLGLYWRLEGSPRSKFSWILGLLAMIPVSYLPNLAVASDYFPYRTRVPISIGILYLLLFAGSGIVRRVIPDEALRRRVIRWSMIVSFAVAIVMTRFHLVKYFIVPSQIEWAVIRTEVTRAVRAQPSDPDQVLFVMPDIDKPVSDRVYGDEFGCIGSSFGWVCKPITGLAVLDIAPAHHEAFQQAEFLMIPRHAPPPAASDGTNWIINARLLNEIGQYRKLKRP